MAESLHSEQVRNKSVVAMPTPLGDIHHWLHDELGWLHIKWSDFRRLYATGQERVDVLNTAAPAFFNQLERMMLEDVLLHLCRITDPVKSVGRDNLTIMRIPDAIPDLALRGVVGPLVDNAKQKSQFARDWRNRRLAHQELPALQGQLAATLPPPSVQNIEDALAAIRKAMNHIERHYLNETVLYEHSMEALGGVEALIARLTKGIEAEKAERERRLGRCL
jgi:hypothetical protein